MQWTRLDDSTAIGFAMKFHYPTLDRPKKAAKRLAAALGDRKLSQVQAAITQSLGYGDWYEFEREAVSASPTPLDQALEAEAFRARAQALTIILSRALDVPEGDVQYALGRSRLTGDRVWTLEDHLAIRAAGWRAGRLAQVSRGEPGELVRVKTQGRKPEFGYLLSQRGACKVMGDISIMDRGFGELVRPKIRPDDFVPWRFWLPYGYWGLSDGSQVVFSRDYFPLWRIAGPTVERLAPWLWITDIVDQTHYFRQAGDGGWAWILARTAARAHLDAKGVSGLPILADAMLALLEPDVTSLHGAVAAQYAARRPSEALPAFASLSSRLSWD